MLWGPNPARCCEKEVRFVLFLFVFVLGVFFWGECPPRLAPFPVEQHIDCSFLFPVEQHIDCSFQHPVEEGQTVPTKKLEEE